MFFLIHFYKPCWYCRKQLIIDRPPDLRLVPLGGDVEKPGHALQTRLLFITEGPARSVGVDKIGVGLALCSQIKNVFYFN